MLSMIEEILKMIKNIEELHKKLEQLISDGYGKKSIYIDGPDCDYTIDSIQQNTNPDIEPEYFILMEDERVEFHFVGVEVTGINIPKFQVSSIKLTEIKPFLPYWTPRFLRVLEFHIRTKIFRQKRYLIDKWKIEK